MNKVQKPYGFRGTIQPASVAKELTEELTIDDVNISVKDGVFEVSYDDPTLEVLAEKIARNLINGWKLRNNITISVDFNHKWHPAATGTAHNLTLQDGIQVSDQITVSSVIIKGMAYIVKPFSDSYSFSNDIDITKKALKDDALAKALQYYSEEVVDHKRPLYGIYKSIEILTKQLGKDGRKKLGELAGYDEKYVDDIMQTTQVQRHATTPGKRKLTDADCKDRARILLQAYANS